MLEIYVSDYICLGEITKLLLVIFYFQFFPPGNTDSFGCIVILHVGQFGYVFLYDSKI